MWVSIRPLLHPNIVLNISLNNWKFLENSLPLKFSKMFTTVYQCFLLILSVFGGIWFFYLVNFIIMMHLRLYHLYSQDFSGVSQSISWVFGIFLWMLLCVRSVHFKKICKVSQGFFVFRFASCYLPQCYSPFVLVLRCIWIIPCCILIVFCI